MARGSRRSSGFLCVFAVCTLLVLIIGVGPNAVVGRFESVTSPVEMGDVVSRE
ncbi:MAG: hypothetical protein ACOYES_04215 [Bacillota bacterium]